MFTSGHYADDMWQWAPHATPLHTHSLPRAKSTWPIKKVDMKETLIIYSYIWGRGLQHLIPLWSTWSSVPECFTWLLDSFSNLKFFDHLAINHCRCLHSLSIVRPSISNWSPIHTLPHMPKCPRYLNMIIYCRAIVSHWPLCLHVTVTPHAI